jgi:hypothetical protein
MVIRCTGHVERVEVGNQKERELETPSHSWENNIKKYHNSVTLVHDRTLPSELLPLVEEVSANFCC